MSVAHPTFARRASDTNFLSCHLRSPYIRIPRYFCRLLGIRLTWSGWSCYTLEWLSVEYIRPVSNSVKLQHPPRAENYL